MRSVSSPIDVRRDASRIEYRAGPSGGERASKVPHTRRWTNVGQRADDSSPAAESRRAAPFVALTDVGHMLDIVQPNDTSRRSLMKRIALAASLLVSLVLAGCGET